VLGSSRTKPAMIPACGTRCRATNRQRRAWG